jgi:rare lipoprotein A
MLPAAPAGSGQATLRFPDFQPGRIALVSAALLLSTGCLHRHRAKSSQAYPQAPQPGAPIPATKVPQGSTSPQVPTVTVQAEEGIASWYGDPFHGRPSASGEIYNMYDLTAAHRTLPFGTQVRVHDLQNGESIDVRINDRGPFVEGRIIDLSYAAAQAIHMVGPGSARVRLELLNPGLIAGPGAEPGVFAVQVGAFRHFDNAERLKARVESRFGPVVVQSFDRGDGLFHRVRVGRESTEEGARALGNQLQQAGFAAQTFVVRLN